MPAANYVEMIRKYTSLKRRLRVATIVGIVSWLSMVQFFVISTFFFNWKDALEGYVVKGHYYLAKGSARQEVTKNVFWFCRCSGILFLVSGPVCLIAGFSAEATQKEIKNVEPKLG